LQHPIYDPTPTVDSGGFDLDAVSVMHLAPVPEPSTLALLFAGAMVLWLSALRRRGMHLYIQRKGDKS